MLCELVTQRYQIHSFLKGAIMATKTKAAPRIIKAKKPPTRTEKVSTLYLKPSSELVYDRDLSAGKNCVVYHVRRRLPKMSITIDNWDRESPVARDLKMRLGADFPNVSNYKWKAIARILNDRETVSIKNREDHVDHTLAMGYNPKHNALVITYSRANRNHEDSRRSVGYTRAMARLQKAQNLANADKIYDGPTLELNMHNKVIESLMTHVAKALRFFKDKSIAHLLLYVDDFEGNMVLVKFERTEVSE